MRLICTGFLLALGLPGSVVAQVTALSAPYQVEGVETRAHHYEGETTFIVVALTRAPAVDEPGAGTSSAELAVPDEMTILGTSGWTVASLYDVEKRCRYPCSLNEGEECHWTGLYSYFSENGDVGTPVAALSGRRELSEYATLDQLSVEPHPMAELQAGDFVPLLWESEPAYRPTYRVNQWDEASGLLSLTIRQPAGDESAIEANECMVRPREWLLAIDCNGLSLVASGGLPLLLSWPDYNSAKAEALVRFHYGGSRHYVVRLGSKAQDVVGLVSGEPVGWRARFRLRDWASLC